jgi:hypothetical protein
MTLRETINTGDRFGRLTVTNPQPAAELPYHVGVKCQCGTTKLVKIYDVIRGRINSCGCIRVETATATLAAHRRDTTRQQGHS